jgi:hypothetical protein
LQPTALVHEVYLKLVDVRKAGWKGKPHFCAAFSSTRRPCAVALTDSSRETRSKKDALPSVSASVCARVTMGLAWSLSLRNACLLLSPEPRLLEGLRWN